MSGQCSQCGNHALECGCQKHIPGPNDIFFYLGKFFEKEEEFWAYVKEFSLRETTEEDFNKLFDMIKKDIWINLSIRKTKISNAELQPILQEALLFILEKCWKEKIYIE